MCQLETRYGHEAEAMLSQPATKIFLRTSEPNAAEWISRTIGGVEIERLKESRSRGHLGSQRKTTSHNNERQIEPLVMDSEISGLANLHGYLKSENLVVRMSFPIIALPKRLPGYLQRSMEVRREEPSQAAAVATSGTLEETLAPHELDHSREHRLKPFGPRQEHFFQ